MDIKQLRFLVALENSQHFGQAAEHCHVTQPTLSMRLKSLEEELGIALVKRGQRFEGFTEEGKRILAWAKQVLSAYDALKIEASACKGQIIGKVRIGIVPLCSYSPIPLLKQLQQDYPQVEVELRALSSEHILEQLSRQQLDAGIAYLEQPGERFQALDLGETRMGLLYHPQLIQQLTPDSLEEISWSALPQLPLGLLSQGMHFRQAIEHNFQHLGLKLQPILETDSVHLLVQSVLAGHCCSIMPYPSYLAASVPGLKLIPISGGRTLYPLRLLIRHSEPTPILAKMLMEAAIKTQQIS